MECSLDDIDEGFGVESEAEAVLGGGFLEAFEDESGGLKFDALDLCGAFFAGGVSEFVGEKSSENAGMGEDKGDALV